MGLCLYHSEQYIGFHHEKERGGKLHKWKINDKYGDIEHHVLMRDHYLELGKSWTDRNLDYQEWAEHSTRKGSNQIQNKHVTTEVWLCSRFPLDMHFLQRSYIEGCLYIVYHENWRR